ncbi:hypothetical protein SBADM41S_09640 [Streptomyces badius]
MSLTSLTSTTSMAFCGESRSGTRSSGRIVFTDAVRTSWNVTVTTASRMPSSQVVGLCTNRIRPVVPSSSSSGRRGRCPLPRRTLARVSAPVLRVPRRSAAMGRSLLALRDRLVLVLVGSISGAPTSSLSLPATSAAAASPRSADTDVPAPPDWSPNAVVTVRIASVSSPGITQKVLLSLCARCGSVSRYLYARTFASALLR